MAINFKMYLLFDLEIHILESDPAVILEVCTFASFFSCLLSCQTASDHQGGVRVSNPTPYKNTPRLVLNLRKLNVESIKIRVGATYSFAEQN